MDQIRLGFIGAGGIAERHLGVLERFSDVRIAGFADVAEDRARRLAERVSARAYTDYRDMLDREAVDALYICVPPFAHGEPEREAIRRGLPFCVEKPIARDLETAEDIARRIEDAALTTAVGYHWRYMDTVEEARERLADNPARLALGYWLANTPPPAWWWREEQSGGQTVEQTTHLFDLARYLIGEVEEVFAAGSTIEREAFPGLDVHDVSAATLRFATGAVGNMAATCLLGWVHRVGMHLFADGMAIELHEHDLMIDVGAGRPVRGAERDPVVAEDRDFLDAVKGKADRIRVPYAEALKTHRVATAAARSAREGRPVSPLSAAEREELAHV